MPAIVLLAAGAGSRFGGVKQLEPVGPAGEALLEYAVFDARRAGFDSVTVVTRRELEDAFQSLRDRLPGDLAFEIVRQDLDDVPQWFERPVERTRPWGTTHALLAARNVVTRPFAMLNADDFYGPAAFELAREATTRAERDATYAVIGMSLEATLSRNGAVSRAICGHDGEHVSLIEEVTGIAQAGDLIRGWRGRETRELSGSELASMNFWVFTPRVFADLAQRFEAFLQEHGGDPAAELALPDAVQALIERGEADVRVRHAPGPWFGLTHAEDRSGVREGLARLASAGTYPDPLWAPPRPGRRMTP